MCLESVMEVVFGWITTDSAPDRPSHRQHVQECEKCALGCASLYLCNFLCNFFAQLCINVGFFELFGHFRPDLHRDYQNMYLHYQLHFYELLHLRVEQIFMYIYIFIY